MYRTALFDIDLAKELGVDKSIFYIELNQYLSIAESVYKSRKTTGNDEYYNGENIYIKIASETTKRIFPYWSISKIKKLARELEKIGMLKVKKINNLPNNWYTISRGK